MAKTGALIEMFAVLGGSIGYIRNELRDWY